MCFLDLLRCDREKARSYQRDAFDKNNSTTIQAQLTMRGKINPFVFTDHHNMMILFKNCNIFTKSVYLKIGSIDYQPIFNWLVNLFNIVKTISKQFR